MIKKNLRALCSGVLLYILDKLATLYLCKYTKCELLASLCYNKIKEREGKPKGNPREQNGGKDYGTG